LCFCCAFVDDFNCNILCGQRDPPTAAAAAAAVVCVYTGDPHHPTVLMRHILISFVARLVSRLVPLTHCAAKHPAAKQQQQTARSPSHQNLFLLISFISWGPSVCALIEWDYKHFI
jgi:hypothetical protein